MSNRSLLIVIALLIGGCLMGMFFYKLQPDSQVGNVAANFFMIVAQLAAVYLLMRNGSTIKTVYWHIIKFGLMLIMIGMLLKFTDWPYGNLFFISGLCITSVTYLIRFIIKKEKNLLAVLKLIWVMSVTIIPMLHIYQLIGAKYLWAGTILLSVTLFDFIVLESRSNKLFHKY
jgi:hypothetical protein